MYLCKYLDNKCINIMWYAQRSVTFAYSCVNKSTECIFVKRCVCARVRLLYVMHQTIILEPHLSNIKQYTFTIKFTSYTYTSAPVRARAPMKKCVKVLMIKLPDIMVISKKCYV